MLNNLYIWVNSCQQYFFKIAILYFIRNDAITFKLSYYHYYSNNSSTLQNTFIATTMYSYNSNWKSFLNPRNQPTKTINFSTNEQLNKKAEPTLIQIRNDGW